MSKGNVIYAQNSEVLTLLKRQRGQTNLTEFRDTAPLTVLSSRRCALFYFKKNNNSRIPSISRFFLPLLRFHLLFTKEKELKVNEYF